MQRALVALAIALSIAALRATPAGAASIVVAPTTVVVGGTVTVSGDVLVDGKPGCALPASVTVISGAFPGNDFGPGIGAAKIALDATGHFSGTVVVNPGAGPGTYTVGGRCGGNLGVAATVTVTALPRTGGSVGPLSDVEAVALGICLVLVGAAGVSLTRRERSATQTKSA